MNFIAEKFFNNLKKKRTSHKYIFIVLITLCFFNVCFSQIALSTEEKLVDFNYLYDEFEKSYPYFDINKRMNQVDWLSKKEEFLQVIKETKNDKDFFIALSSILNALNNDHTDTYPTVIYDYFYKAYKGASDQDSSYLPYLQELEKTDTIRTKYWREINSAILSELKVTDNNESSPETYENIEIDFKDSLSVALIHVKSFSYDYVEDDFEKLKRFFNKAHNYKNLIIDIQGNGGGDTEYWMGNIIPYLINDAITFSMTYGFKKSYRLKKFKPNYFENIISYDEAVLPNMPKELKNGSYLFRRDNIVINPVSNPKKYSGNIYLLVDDVVFSSAETLAYFCKSTKFATVVGEKTNGDGVGTDPLLITLPKSGIVIRFTGEMGLNPDGSANDETKTVPDVILKASNKKERIAKLLNYIKNKA
tara:strand:- start:2177 stop:3433 length:1257 start_codon:yes stop_codon:yes gene_type:complete